MTLTMFFRHLLGPLVILVRLIPVLLSMPVRGDLCPNYPISNPAIVMHINSTTGTQHCCKRILCSAGTEVQYCSEHNPNDTACRPCQNGFYSKDARHSDQNPTCHPWKRCIAAKGQIANKDGTNIFEGTCNCNTALGYYLDKWGNCNVRKIPCDADHELDEKTGACVPCRLGYEQPLTGFGPCRACRVGTHRSSHSQLNCTPCAAGKYATREGQHKCMTCKELIEAKEPSLNCNPDFKSPVTPKFGATIDGDGSSNSMLWKVLAPVLCIVPVIVIVLFVLLKRRQQNQQQKQNRRESRQSPVHSPKSVRPNYRAVSSSSTSSSDDTSRSSAEDSVEAEKIRAQNLMNQGVTAGNEKTALPQGDISRDSPTSPVAQAPPSETPAGMPQDPERFLIVNPTNCNITLGHSNQLSMTPAPPPERLLPARPSPTDELPNSFNTPRSRQSAPPKLDLNQSYSNGMAPMYHEDEADRLAAHYNGSNC